MMTMRKSVLGVVLLALAVLSARAADWKQFRGPSGSGVSPETNLPVKWGKTKGLRYKVELPGRGLSNPVIAGGRVYVTACSGYRETRLHVLCFDEATGKKLWERQCTATGSTSCHTTTCMAAPTPATDGKAVYALFATGDLAAYDKAGALLWYRSLVGDYPNITNQVGMASSPVLAGSALMVPMDNGGDSFIAGIDTATGKNLWRLKRGKTINWVTPLIVEMGGRPAALFPMPGNVTAVDPMTGKVRWKYESGDVSSIPSPSFGDGVLFSPTGANGLKALKPGNDGTPPKELWSIADFGGGYPSPVYLAGRVYGLGRVNVKCVSAADGMEVWKHRMDGPFSASPVVADGKLYAVNNKGVTTVLELGDKPKILAKNDIGDTILATPAIANGCIYLRSDKYLYCIGAVR
jgi:outer membrane protein assembly factor BamB